MSAMKLVCVILLIGVFCLTVCNASENDPGVAIQIAVPVNHVFQLRTEQIKAILENENIKNRKIAVVSIAGAFRQGKSFLLNFFLRYLHAQYKVHNVTDWIGESTNATGLHGFQWRAGRKRETIGIWMWSEAFTHDFINGEKVAIILLDTQGIFDDKSSVRDCTTTFALSMMLSSVQCYNLMQNIREDDLQYLELFSEYGRLALEQSVEKPFQKLIFIIRDWPFAYETNYGWNGQQIINETLAGNEDQTCEMRRLRERIRASFEDISAFLMPHPGMKVAQSNSFTGNLNEISPDFVKYVKELVPALFAPENLCMKKINGQTVRAQDFLKYLEAYINIFNGEALPEPRSVLMATAEVTNSIIFNDCVNLYDDSMKTSIASVETYYKEAELVELHQRRKSEALAKFMEKPKLGGDELTASFRRRLEETIQQKFNGFKAENEQKYKDYIELKVNPHNERLFIELFDRVKSRVFAESDHAGPDAVHTHLHNIFNGEQQTALDQFASRKMGEDAISNVFHEKLDQEMKSYQTTLSQTLDTFNHGINHYSRRMQESLNGVDYFPVNELMNVHQRIRNEAISQAGEDGLKFKLQQKMEQKIDESLPHYENQNVAKRHSFREASRRVEFASISAFRWPHARASCPSGMTLTGGGGNCRSDGRGWVFLYQSRPENNDWIVSCDTPESQHVIAEAWAFCVAILQ